MTIVVKYCTCSSDHKKHETKTVKLVKHPDGTYSNHDS
jgi:hypothetical protein